MIDNNRQQCTAQSANLSNWSQTKTSSCMLYSPNNELEIVALLQNSGSLGNITYGNGLNYGDQAFNTQGSVISMRHFNRLWDFNRDNGMLICGAGVSIYQILQHCLPLGWGLPVIPGTSNVTVGGAIANDVHGKEQF